MTSKWCPGGTSVLDPFWTSFGPPYEGYPVINAGIRACLAIRPNIGVPGNDPFWTTFGPLLGPPNSGIWGPKPWYFSEYHCISVVFTWKPLKYSDFHWNTLILRNMTFWTWHCYWGICQTCPKRSVWGRGFGVLAGTAQDPSQDEVQV